MSRETKTLSTRTQFLPDRLKTSLRYVLCNTITATAATAYAYQFRLNSIYDPDYTAAGHQPLGRDELSTLYSKYLVTSVDVEFMLVNKAATTFATGMVVHPYHTATVKTQIVDAAEQSGAEMFVLPGSDKLTFKRHYDLRKIVGHKLDPEVQGADFGADPTDPIFLDIYFQDMAYTSSQNIDVLIRLTYNCELTESKLLNQS